MVSQRRKSRKIKVGWVEVGGDAPLRVQSMTTTKTADVNATLQQMASLVATGVDIVRVAVPHWEDAEARGVPIRIGVNAGSLEKDLLEKYGRPRPEALVESALNEVRILEDEDFFDIKISVKHSSPKVMIEAYRQLAQACDYPLHLGVTEAGPMPMGGVKSAVGIGTLLADGIGDTIR